MARACVWCFTLVLTLAATAAPAAQNAAAPVRVGQAIRPPTKIRDVRPKYPEAALAAGVQGVVILEVTIGPDGAVQETRILRSIPLLDDAAVSAVREWQFAPTLLNGAPTPIIMTVTVNFTLDELTPHPCAEEPSLKSATPVTPRSIRFFNAGAAPRKVYWLDSSGERRLYATVDPRSSYVQATFAGHPWVVTDAQDVCTAVYLALERGGQATLR